MTKDSNSIDLRVTHSVLGPVFWLRDIMVSLSGFYKKTEFNMRKNLQDPYFEIIILTSYVSDM